MIILLETGKLNLWFQIVRKNSWRFATHWFPCEKMSEDWAKKFHSDIHHCPDLDSASDWVKICCKQSEALPRSGLQRVISMELLHLFLRRHFAGKPVRGKMLACFSGLISFLLRVFHEISIYQLLEESG